MKKRTGIVLAGLAGSCVAPLAHAQGTDLTIYGRAHVSVESLSSSGKGKTQALKNNTSRLGFRGKEALGDGLEAFFQIEVDADGHELPAQDPRRKPTFRFDAGDAHWARAMVLFQHAILNIVMAYDFSAIERFVLSEFRDMPEAFTLRLADKDRIKQAKAIILDGLAAAERSRQLYLAETDDASEWVPNPKQRNHPLPLPVDDALYQTWGKILGDLVRLVQGQEGLGIAELAQLGDHTWKKPPQGYLDIGKLLDQPADIVVHGRTLEGLGELRSEDPAPAEKVLRELFGDKYRPAMKPSPLLRRLGRMKAEIERGHESFERKLRYLLWLN